MRFESLLHGNNCQTWSFLRAVPIQQIFQLPVCDALLMRDVYHHIMRPEVFDRSAVAALKAGGRLAVIDFEPEPGSELPAGVPASR
jgi:hypothetical protein